MSSQIHEIIERLDDLEGQVETIKHEREESMPGDESFWDKYDTQFKALGHVMILVASTVWAVFGILLLTQPPSCSDEIPTTQKVQQVEVDPDRLVIE